MQEYRDTICRLEARIRDLEHPDLALPSIMLHDPCTPTVPQSSPPALSFAAFDDTSAFPDPDVLSAVFHDNDGSDYEPLP